jgi:hypothetical protein
LNVAIIDADLAGRKGHRFPNLCCMKISGYQKELGHNVKLITDYRQLFSEYIELPTKTDPDFDFIVFEQLKKSKVTRYYQATSIIYDKIFICKVFTDTKVPIGILSQEIVEYGGTGFYYDEAPDLPYEIEHHMPDYHLYDEWVDSMIEQGWKTKEFEYYTDYSIGYRTRKCFRKCSFCVNRNYNHVEPASPIEEFHDPSRKYICCLDDNFFGHPKWKEMLLEVQSYNKPFQFKQGLDERLLTKEKSELLSKSKYKGDYIFAFDNIEDREIVEEKMKIWRQFTNPYTSNTKLYVFCGFDRNEKYNEAFWLQDIIDLFKRIRILMTYGCIPYIMRHENYDESPYRGMYITIARWSNQISFFKKQSLREFVFITDAKGREDKDFASKRYLREFEKDYPEIAKEYFDLKFEELNKYSKSLQTL